MTRADQRPPAPAPEPPAAEIAHLRVLLPPEAAVPTAHRREFGPAANEAEADATGRGARADAMGRGARADAMGRGARADAMGRGARADVTGRGARAVAMGRGARADAMGRGARADATGRGARADITGRGARAVAMGRGARADVTGNGTRAAITGHGAGADATAPGAGPEAAGHGTTDTPPRTHRTALIDGITLRLHPGRITALVGASGSGKTTTGLALLGEYPPGALVTGEVRVPAGRVGYVPQHPATALNPARRVGALLRDIARAQVRDLRLPRRDRRTAVTERVLRACAEAQLPDAAPLLRRYPHQLSGGQQQRFVLAQALLAGCRVVVADEPTTGQDPLTKRHIAARFAALARQGIAVLLLSHDLDVVHALADEIHVMHEGRILESGPPDRLRQSPQHPHTQALLTPQLPQLPQFPQLPQPRKLPDAAKIPPPASHPTPESALAPQEKAPRPLGPAPIPPPDTPPGPTLHGTPADGAPADGAPSPPPLLHIPTLTAHHHRTPALHIPSLTLRAGECLAVVGRSGSGKTTLGRCLAGLHRTYEGEIRLDGTVLPRSLRARTREQLAAVQYVFQDARAAFDEHRPVLDQVARTAVRLRAVPADEAQTEARRTLTALGLPEGLVHRRPHQLSGGELQRAALARALLAHPRVLICDEITSGLDAVTRRSLLALLADLLHTRPDLALILITHDPETAALATHTAAVDTGHLTEPAPAPAPTPT